MPTPEVANRYETAVLWIFNGFNQYSEFVVESPIELRVRWEESKRVAVNAQGNTIGIDGTIFTNRVIPVNSLLRLGTLASITDLTNPDSLVQVVGFEDTPDIKGRLHQRDALFIRYKNKLPQILGTGT